jgi:DNA-binding GntR family transcriptional regulator
MVFKSGPAVASQVGRAHREIRRAILEGRYEPGAPLSELLLARQHSTSRTPVREALSRLLQEGYVEHVAGRGFFAARVTLQGIHETFDVRRLLEGVAAERAAKLAQDDDIARIRVLAAYHYEPGNAHSHRQAMNTNVQFHLAIAAASRNTFLVELIHHCLLQTNRFLSLGLDLGRFQDAASREHQRIAQAIEQRNAVGARQRVERHLDRSSRLVMEALMRGEIRGVAI